MKKVFFCFVLTIFGLGACVSDSQLKQLDPYYVFHENNSKVWLIDHLYKDNMDHAPISTVYKEVMIFHKNKVCYVYKLKEIGEKKGKKADFTLDATEKEMRFIFHNERWIFELILVSHNKIILRPKNGSKFLYTIELIPLPEF